MIKVWADVNLDTEREVETKFSTFPGGEEHVFVGEIAPKTKNVVVEAHIRSSSELMRMFLISDALNRRPPFPEKTFLYLPYVPYARQDRVCNAGEAYSLGWFIKTLNVERFGRVIIADPHSIMSETQIARACVIKQTELSIVPVINSLFGDEKPKTTAIVSPDKGAYGKSIELLGTINPLRKTTVIRMNKRREEGDIAIDFVGTSGLPIHEGTIIDNAIIVDDICDGGGTFINLAKKLRELYIIVNLDLYVTHGIFSKGLGVLFDAGIRNIYTTDSVCEKTDVSIQYIKTNKLYVSKIDWRKYV